MVGKGINQVIMLLVSLAYPVQLLIYIGYTLGPDFLFPSINRKRLSEHSSAAV